MTGHEADVRPVHLAGWTVLQVDGPVGAGRAEAIMAHVAATVAAGEPVVLDLRTDEVAADVLARAAAAPGLPDGSAWLLVAGSPSVRDALRGQGLEPVHDELDTALGVTVPVLTSAQESAHHQDQMGVGMTDAWLPEQRGLGGLG